MISLNRLVLPTLTLAATLILFYLFLPPHKPQSPTSSQPILGTNHTTNSLRILGFLPYWNHTKVTTQALENITDLIYFALDLDSDGSIIQYESRYAESPGWTNLQRLRKDPQTTNLPLTVALQMLDDDAISTLLNSPTYRSRAISQIIELILAHDLKGINLDFEPSGPVSQKTKDNFTLFVSELSQQLSAHRLTGVELSIDIYPTLLQRSVLWDLPRLSPYLAYVVVMGYDYHYRGSDTAGPVAPLRGEGNFFNDDLVTNLGEISRIISPEQIILGIPFYGYEWSTQTAAKYSPTLGRGVTASLRRVEDILATNPESLHWDRNSLTPYLVLSDNNSHTQIYFENDLSLGLKLDLVTTSNFRGIAIWALGYESESPTLWQTLKKRLSAP